MPFIPAANTAKVVMNMRLHGQRVTNTIYVEGPSPFDASGLSDLAAAIWTWWGGSLNAFLSDGIALESVTARSMHTEEAPGIEYTGGAPLPGDVASPALPGNVALAVRLKTGLTGRNRTGRIFIGGLPEGAVVGNTVDPATVNGIAAALQTLIELVVTPYGRLVVASFYNGTALTELPNGERRRLPVPRATALLTEVLTAVAEPYTDSQRRRLTGRGV